MHEIVKILTGSHLYGCALPGSDRDYKVVFLPSARDILLQEKKSQSKAPVLAEGEELETISVRKFLHMACQGQTNALDMLFAPPEFYVGPVSPIWEQILAARQKFLSKDCRAFVGYCREQASKYSVKAERLETLEKAVTLLSRIPHHEVLNQDLALWDRFCARNPFAALVPIENAQGKVIEHLQICETMVPVTISAKNAYITFSEKYQKYGERAKRAQNMGNKDWKALYHAVRVAEEALELLKTGKITFPRPEREFLLAIRRGEVAYSEISELLTENLGKLKVAEAESALPEKPDQEFAENLLLQLHLKVVEASLHEKVEKKGWTAFNLQKFDQEFAERHPEFSK